MSFRFPTGMVGNITPEKKNDVFQMSVLPGLKEVEPNFFIIAYLGVG